LRSAYLATIKDGIGDRLINLNPSILNNPGFRAAGWGTIANSNAALIKRTYSPPIPTASAVASEYFQATYRHNLQDDAHSDATSLRVGDEDDDDDPRMAAGGRRSPGNMVDRLNGRRVIGRKLGRRIRHNQRALTPAGERNDDSSDLSDDSDDSERCVSTQEVYFLTRISNFTFRAVQQIKFTKMPVRNRAGSSPIRSSADRRAGPDVLVTSPSLRSTDNRFRRSSLGAVETIKVRARRDTTTSSDLSSDNETGPAYPRTRQIHFSSHEEIITREEDEEGSEKLEEEEEDETEPEMEEDLAKDEDWIAESVGSALFSDFGATAGSGSLLNRVGIAGSLDGPSSPLTMNKAPAASASPRKPKMPPPELQSLPPPRPISTVESASALTAMLKARKNVPVNPLDRFALLSGKSLTAPLYIKVYFPTSSAPDKPVDMPMARESKDSGFSAPVMVMEAIGLALWRYVEDSIKPPLEGEKLNVNRWNMRMVEDGEVDYDFPPLLRNRPFADFTSNNNRAAGLRARARSKPYDEFAIVEATPEEFAENERRFPKFSTAPPPVVDEPATPTVPPVPTQQGNTIGKPARLHPMLGNPFPSALNDSSLTPADLPAAPISHATPRTGSVKTLKIRYVDSEQSTRVTTVSTSTDSYIAEIIDSVCKRWGLDRGSFVLKVIDSNTVVPLDRTVEALGGIANLDLVRRRFPGGPISLTGSPVSASPNAPLMVDSANWEVITDGTKYSASNR
jgi:hypothetical protein